MTVTAQETFDRVVAHLASMDHQSMMRGSTTACAYRAPDGNKCAVGCLIDDTEYTKDIETKGAWALLDGVDVTHTFPTLRMFYETYRPYSGMIGDLQRAHDDSTKWLHDREPLKSQLRYVATQFDVDPAIIDTVTWVQVSDKQLKLSQKVVDTPVEA